jgi:hypothetical protein
MDGASHRTPRSTSGGSRAAAPARSKTRGRRIASVMIPIVCTALGSIATIATQQLVQEGADRGKAVVDVRRFSIDVSYPNSGCSYGAAVGWEQGLDTEETSKLEDPVADTIRRTSQMGDSGLVRLHFSLPTTADMTSIDVRSIQLEAIEDGRGAPSWAILPTDCGAGQYSRVYEVEVDNAKPRMTLVSPSPDGELQRKDGFEPFSVSAGEKVFMDFEIRLCDAATYGLKFAINYVADTGEELSISVPEDRAITMTGLYAAHQYVDWDNGTLEEDDRRREKPSNCN